MTLRLRHSIVYFRNLLALCIRSVQSVRCSEFYYTKFHWRTTLSRRIFWGQVLSSLAGMLNLIMVTRSTQESAFRITLLRWSTTVSPRWLGGSNGCRLRALLQALSSRHRRTFYALLMSIQNAGLLMSGWWGGLMLQLLNVTRTEFSNLWVAVLIRNLSRLLPLMLLFLVPQSDQNSMLLPAEMLQDNESTEARKGGQDTAEFFRPCRRWF